MSIPLYDSALMFSALLLMVVVGGFSLAAHLTLLKIERRGIRESTRTEEKIFKGLMLISLFLFLSCLRGLS